MFNNWGKKSFYKQLIKKIERSIWDMELRIVTIKEIREGIRQEFDRTAGIVKEIETRLGNEKDEKAKDELRKTQKEYQNDTDSLREQMIGKWSEAEAKYNGGIDQEIKAVEEKIQGAVEFQELIKRELKRL